VRFCNNTFHFWGERVYADNITFSLLCLDTFSKLISGGNVGVARLLMGCSGAQRVGWVRGGGGCRSRICL
jgi:hypothetical protein